MDVTGLAVISWLHLVTKREFGMKLSASVRVRQRDAAGMRARQVVKGYEQGKLSKHIVGLKEGDILDFKGPVMNLTYEPNMKKAIGMVCPVSWEPKRLFVQLTSELHFDKKMPVAC